MRCRPAAYLEHLAGTQTHRGRIAREVQDVCGKYPVGASSALRGQKYWRARNKTALFQALSTGERGMRARTSRYCITVQKSVWEKRKEYRVFNARGSSLAEAGRGAPKSEKSNLHSRQKRELSHSVS
eukprot:1091247-Pelagomonas_calceolata.AAC.1